MTGIRAVWNWWKRIAHWLGNLQARVILTVFYFVILAPFALVVRMATDPLAMKPGTARGWQSRPAPDDAHMERALRQS